MDIAGLIADLRERKNGVQAQYNRQPSQELVGRLDALWTIIATLNTVEQGKGGTGVLQIIAWGFQFAADFHNVEEDNRHYDWGQSQEFASAAGAVEEVIAAYNR